MDLDSELGRDAIEALRERGGLGATRRDALFERLEHSIAAGEATRLTADIEAGDAEQVRHDLSDERRRRRGWMIVAAAAVALLGWSAWRSLSQELGTDAEREPTEAVDHAAPSQSQGEVVHPEPVAVSVPEPSPIEPPPRVEPPPAAEPEPVVSPPPKKRKGTRRSTQPKEAPPPSNADTLKKELALLRKARAATKRNEPKTALSYLEQHRREFAEGQLKRERDALRVELLCRIDPARGQQAKTAFLRGSMSKSLRTRVGAVRCDSDQ